MFVRFDELVSDTCLLDILPRMHYTFRKLFFYYDSYLLTPVVMSL